MLLCLASRVAPGHFPELQKTHNAFFNLIVTAHVLSCVMCVLLYIFNFMLLFIEPFSCSSGISLNSFLNIYNGIMLPSLWVSILYGISVTVLPTCIFRCAVINDWFLLRYIEFILTVSISSSWGSGITSTSTSWTVQFLLLMQTFLKWPIFLQLVHDFPYAGHCLGAWLPPQYLHGCLWNAWCVVSISHLSLGFWTNLTLSNFCASGRLLNIAACALCASICLAHNNMSSLFICLLLFFAINSLTTSSNMALLFNPCMNCSFNCLSISL